MAQAIGQLFLKKQVNSIPTQLDYTYMVVIGIVKSDCSLPNEFDAVCGGVVQDLKDVGRAAG